MSEIVTLAEAKLWLRLEPLDGEEDAKVAMLIAAATETALATAEGYDPATPPPASIKLAILTHVARVFDTLDTGDAPEGNVRLLGPYRTLGI